jgi:hypothetical protein
MGSSTFEVIRPSSWPSSSRALIRERFPLNHTRLVEELKRRERAEAPDSPSPDRWDIRFSRSESFWSWIQAKRRRQWPCQRPKRSVHPNDQPEDCWYRHQSGNIMGHTAEIRAPPKGDSAIKTPPLCHSMARLTIASPNPNPVSLVRVDSSCTKESNTLCRSVSGIPGPSSSTSN